MSQHDFSIANQTSLSARTDINNGLQALASNSSGSSAPTTTYANMFWYDTTNNILKVRNEVDSAWIDVIYINQSTGVTSILDNTNLVTSGGSTTGLLGDQLQNIWNAGTGTTESLVSPLKIRSSVVNYVDSIPTWDYISNQTTITANSTATFTHGLGAAPSLIQLDLVCKTANNGYSVGDRLMSGGSQLQASSNRGYVLMIPNNNTTEIKIVTLGTNRIPNAAGNAEVNALWTQWDAIIKAKL
jgi:hypothetical protein